MKPGIPWSIKGVEPELREAAKSAARRSGMTLGEWLNSAINTQADSAATANAAAGAGASVLAPRSRNSGHALDRAASRLDDIAEKLSLLAQRETGSAIPKPAGVDDQLQFAKILSRVESHEKQTVEAFSAVNERLATIGRQLGRTAAAAPKFEETPGYKSLENAVRNIVEHLDISEKRSRENMKSLHDRLSDMSAKLMASGNDNLLRQAPAFTALESRLSDLSRRVEQAPQVPAEQLRQEITRLSGRIETLHESSESLANRAQTQAVQATQAELHNIEGRIVGLLNEAKQSISANHVSHSELQRFRQEIENLNARIDQVAQPSAQEHDVGALKAAIEQLSTRVAQGQDTRPLADLDRKIIDIASKLERAEAATRALPLASDLDRRFAELEERLTQSLQNPLGDTAALTQKLSEVDDRLARSEAQLGHLSTIERAITQLYDTLEQTRNQTHDIAHAAASRMADQLAATNGGAPVSPGSSDEIRALEAGLRAVREAAASADQRNQETLEAVHETLEQVVGKLLELENGMSGRQAASAAGLAPAPPHAAAAPAVDPFVAAALSLARGAGAPNLPEQGSPALEPQPEAYSDPAQAASLPPQDPLPESAGDDADDFVAAARRLHLAAQGKSAPMPELKAGQRSTAKATRGFNIPFLSKNKGAPAKAEPAKAAPQADGPLLAGITAASAKSGSRLKLVAMGVLLLALASFSVNNFIGRKHASAPVMDAPAAQEQVAPAEPGNKGSSAADPQSAPADAPKANPGQQGALSPGGFDPILTGALPNVETATNGAAVEKNMDQIPVAVSAPSDNTIEAAVGPGKLIAAAQGGDASAQFIVASHYLDGDTVPADFKKAAYWYGKAAANGLAPAQYRLATMYERGKGVELNLTAAIGWYEKAAAQGNVKAMHNAAVLAAGTDAGPPDYAKAVKWFTGAARHGLKDSEYNLAVMIERGLGAKADSSEALFWYMAAAAQGDADSKARVDALSKALSPSELAAIKSKAKDWKPEKELEAANQVSVDDSRWNPGTQAAASDGSNINDQAKQLLDKLGYRVGAPDGTIDQRTATAIRLFQIRSNLQVTGKVTPELINVLQKATG